MRFASLYNTQIQIVIIEIEFTVDEADHIHRYINLYQFELDYPDEEERMNVLKKVMVATSMSKLPIKFKKYLGRYRED